MVDAHVSGTCVARHGGSSPLLGTKFDYADAYSNFVWERLEP